MVVIALAAVSAIDALGASIARPDPRISFRFLALRFCWHWSYRLAMDPFARELLYVALLAVASVTCPIVLAVCGALPALGLTDQECAVDFSDC